MNSVGQKISDMTRWVGKQVVGRDDFRGASSNRTRDLATFGAAAGAVVGGTAGAIAGFHSQSGNTIEEKWVNRTIVDKTMNGYSHNTSRDYSYPCVEYDKDNNCTRTDTVLDGWHHSYSPNISERVVGNYTEPTFHSTKFWEPLKGGALGAVGGSIMGLGIGIGLAALERAIQGEKAAQPAPKLSPEAERALTTRAGAATIGGALLGATVGAFAGRSAGVIEFAAKQSHMRQWNTPVMETKTLGYVPSSHYERNWFGSTWASPDDVNTNANQPVNREVPEYDRGGDPRMRVTEKIFNTNRYGPIFGGIAGGVIGAGVGLAAGLAIGVGDKLLGEYQAKGSPAT